MLAYALRRVLWTVPILLFVVTVTFFMLRGIGGDPLRPGTPVGFGSPAWSKQGDAQPESIRRNLERRFGLDDPWYVQYADYLGRLVTLDFGHSTTFRQRTVISIVAEQAPRSLELGLLAVAWMLALGVPAGVLAALRAGSGADDAVRALSAGALAVPNFLVGTLLVYVLSVKLGWLPTSGWEGWRSKVLPSFTLGLLPAAITARLVRAAMLDTLRQEYVAAARAKGLRPGRVVVAHVLRNSLAPALNAWGPLLAHLLTGAFVIEYLFSIPGIGRYYVSSVLARDYPVVLAVTALLAAFVVVANLLVDLAQAALDPRTREPRAA